MNETKHTDEIFEIIVDMCAENEAPSNVDILATVAKIEAVMIADLREAFNAGIDAEQDAQAKKTLMRAFNAGEELVKLATVRDDS